MSDTTQAAATSAPWKLLQVGGTTKIIAWFTDGGGIRWQTEICTMGGHGYITQAEIDANARLIMTAAQPPLVPLDTLVEVLEQCREYFADRADADHNGERFVANPAMQLQMAVDVALAIVKKASGAELVSSKKEVKLDPPCQGTVTPRQPITVPCPICNSAPGSPCTRSRVAGTAGWVGEMHVGRVRKSQELETTNG